MRTTSTRLWRRKAPTRATWSRAQTATTWCVPNPVLHQTLLPHRPNGIQRKKLAVRNAICFHLSSSESTRAASLRARTRGPLWRGQMLRQLRLVQTIFQVAPHPGGNPGANLKSISHRYYLREVALEWELTKKPCICPWVVSRVVKYFDLDIGQAGHQSSTPGHTLKRFFSNLNLSSNEVYYTA